MARESRTPDEFSRPVSVRDIPADGIVRRLEATPDECAAIARRLGVLAVSALTAELGIRRWRRDGLSITGSFTGQVEQASVVSLEPVGAELSEEIALRLLPEGGRQAGSDTGPEVVVDAMADDPPETFSGDSVDLGALVLEHLAMAIDPYPRKAGEEFPADEVSSRVEQEESDPTKQSPFAVLEALKREDEGK